MMIKRKKRGPGRPKGSRNRPKSPAPPAVVDARLAAIQRRLETVPSVSDVSKYVQDLTTDWSYTLKTVVDRQADLRQRLDALAIDFKRLVADAEHPTTQLLARRLISLETAERITKGVHERLTQLETELRTLRQEFGELVTERHAERNRAEVQRIAEGDGGPDGR